MFAASKGSRYTNKDPQFAYTSVLVHADGTNGTNNTSFVDGSSYNQTVTPTGVVAQGTFSPFSQTGWCVGFNGSSEYITVSDNAALAFGTGDFHIEAWIYLTNANVGGNYAIFSKGTNASTGFMWRINSGNGLELVVGASTTYTASGYFTTFSGGYFNQNTALNKWVHVMVGRVSSNVYFGLNGEIVQRGTDTTNITTSDLGIIAAGRGAIAGNYFPGFISNLRVIKGTNPYGISGTTSGLNKYIVPTTPLTTVSGTSLLTCQSNRYVDNSSYALTLTATNFTGIKAASPFSPAVPYDSTLGASTYFSGDGNYLTIPYNSRFNLGTNNYTVEFWYYPTSLQDFSFVVGQNNNNAATSNFDIAIGTSTVYFENYSGAGNYPVSSGSALLYNVWTHIAGVRNGNTFSLYINGVSVGSPVTAAAALNSNAVDIAMGRRNSGTASAGILGYVSNLRLVNGTAVYTSNFTPPTAPVTAIANTVLLVNSTNASIINQTADNNLYTASTAKISTAQKQFGTGSMIFNGTSDYVLISPGLANSLGLGDFTVEFWIYCNSISSSQTILYQGTATTGEFQLLLSNPGTLTWYQSSSSTCFTLSNAIAASTWTHVAVTRSAGTSTFYINGTHSGNFASGSYPGGWYNFTATTGIYIGSTSAGGNYFSGYMDDLRITPGYARYTGDFSPPPSPFGNQ